MAHRALSVDPDRYPIEPRILPLVFELKRLRIFDPCWSCEGHLGTDGSLWKLPSVWFYCSGMVYLRLLADGLNHLKRVGILHAPWEVAVTYSDADNPDTTFSLQPVFAQLGTTSLTMLQEDVREIACSLDAMMEAGGRALQDHSRRAGDARQALR